MSKPIPVVDLFAGPGGLGEGFSASGFLLHQRRFEIAISIERDAIAHQTLKLRSFFRRLDGRGRSDYYRHLAGPDGFDASSLYALYPRESEAAEREAWCMELRPDTAGEIGGRIRGVLKGADPWVLIGGPPCQAYSLAGRSRNRGTAGYVPENDSRQYLYREYLQIIADHAPAVFVMENVKGLLSAVLAGERVFTQIRADLERPTLAIRQMGRGTCGDKSLSYTVHSLVSDRLLQDDEVEEYRGHMPMDLHRSLFAASLGQVGNAAPPPMPRQRRRLQLRTTRLIARQRRGWRLPSNSSRKSCHE